MTASPGTSSFISTGLRLSGAVNVLGVLVFSAGFTNRTLTSLSPVVFSRFGLVSILLWGLAYLAVSSSYRQVPWLLAVFALEKLVYVATWVSWITRFGGTLPALFARSPLSATFFAIYGPNDLLFGFFFAFAAMRTFRGQGISAA